MFARLFEHNGVFFVQQLRVAVSRYDATRARIEDSIARQVLLLYLF